jgi:nucleoside-diphosphate kinase
MTMDVERERTLLLIKPDAVRRGLVGQIVLRVEQAGLAIIGIRMHHASREFAAGHYSTSDDQLTQMGSKLLASFIDAGLDVAYEFGTEDPIELGRMIAAWNVDYISSGAVVAVAIEGYHAVGKVRALCGPTMPSAAAPGTIRGDYSTVSALVASGKKAAVRNLVHASDNSLDPGEPEREIEYWFGTDLCQTEPVSWGVIA